MASRRGENNFSSTFWRVYAAMTCVYCGKSFEKDVRGFKRHSFASKVRDTQQTVKDAAEVALDLTSMSPTVSADRRALCNTCYGLLEKIYKRKKETVMYHEELEKRAHQGSYIDKKRKRQTPIKTPRKSSKKYDESQRRNIETGGRSNINVTKIHSFLTRIVELIKRSQYLRAFNLLLQKSKAARRSFFNCVTQKIRHEVHNFLREDTVLKRPMTKNVAADFSWGDILSETRNEMPLLHTVLEAAVTRRLGYDKINVSDTSYGPLVPGLGMVISLILHLHSPKRIKLVQQMNSIQMFKAGVSQKVFQVFGKLGICMGLTGTRLLADRLISGFDDDIMSLKRNIECELSDSDNLQVQALEGSCNPVTTQVRQRLFEADDSNCVGVQPLQEEQFNRVSFRHLDDLDSEPTQRASDIDLERFLPTVYDWNLLRVRMELLVTRIICKHMEYFSSLKEEIQGFISHPYIKESTEKSTIFNLGIIKENPASNKGVVAIMKNLKKYVPQRGPGDPYRVLCHGDQLSAERMVEGRQAMASSENPFDRLIGLEPNCQDFHERCIILQDTMNILYDGKSADNEGSLFHLKTIFQHRNVRKNISDCINHVDSLLNFTTEALVVLAAMKLLNIGGIDDIPDNAPDQSEDRQQHLKTLAAKIVALVWPNIDDHSIRKAVTLEGHDNDDDDDNDDTVCCSCGSDADLDGGWIECSARGKCPRHRWYHVQCVCH
ncbi:uncharacterized protein [Ptychodera flava]|uniref:uncharacterized protein isoform X2 n=1 Tax=Ptychodera flava TaxID=63121 RepID=UPI003969F6E0